MNIPVTHKFPEHFLDEEVRCGYLVTERQKKIWAIEIDLLMAFDDVCKRHGIRYHVSFGALLGAVRHKGFIPWDDDIDVWLTRDEFKKLEAVADEFKHPYFLQTLKTEKTCFLSPARLRNSQTTAIIAGLKDVEINHGIYIDIDVLDKSTYSKSIYLLGRLFYKFALNCLEAHKAVLPPTNLTKKYFRFILGPFISFFPRAMWVSFYEWSRGAFGSSKVLNPISMSSVKKGYRITATEATDTIWIPFEFLLVPAPKEYESVLKKIYGDYMVYPPAADRGKWHESTIHFEPEIPYKVYLSDR